MTPWFECRSMTSWCSVSTRRQEPWVLLALLTARGCSALLHDGAFHSVSHSAWSVCRDTLIQPTRWGLISKTNRERRTRIKDTRTLSSLLSYSSSQADAGDSSQYANGRERERFGSKDYWEECYASAKDTDGKEGQTRDSAFSWYCTWEELSPFWHDLVPEGKSVLVPGVGNDPILQNLHDAGYTHLSAFDYAPSSVDCVRNLLVTEDACRDIRLDVADARDLSDVYDNASFDAILDKGTLDAVFLIGGEDKLDAQNQVSLAVREFQRVMKPGGVFFSVTGVSGATNAIDKAFQCVAPDAGSESQAWEKICDTREEVYFTEDGFASIDVDATLLAWVRRS